LAALPRGQTAPLLLASQYDVAVVTRSAVACTAPGEYPGVLRTVVVPEDTVALPDETGAAAAGSAHLPLTDSVTPAATDAARPSRPSRPSRPQPGEECRARTLRRVRTMSEFIDPGVPGFDVLEIPASRWAEPAA
jgi:hypothetical protein